MEKGNVLVIGNSGVGKSTLINAVLGEERAETGFGTEGTTKELKIYENDEVDFRIIDTIGFEPSFFKQQQAVNAVKKWSKDGIKEGKPEKHINTIWFCVDGCSAKLFDDTIKNLIRATSIWSSVPVIVVITKSYSLPDRDKNIEMVKEAFSKNKKYSKNLKQVIPVVAQTYILNDTAFAPPEGITELIDVTIEIIPEGIEKGTHDIEKYKLKRKKQLAQTVVSGSVVAGATIGAIPIPLADAVILTPLEIAEINAIATVYGINKDEKAKQLMNHIIEIGTVSVAAKALIGALKAIPGLNIGANLLNAVVAATIVGAIGEGSISVFEKIYTGEKTLDDIDWVNKIIEKNLANGIVEKINSISGKLSDKLTIKDVGKIIADLFANNKKVD